MIERKTKDLKVIFSNKKNSLDKNGWMTKEEEKTPELSALEKILVTVWPKEKPNDYDATFDHTNINWIGIETADVLNALEKYINVKQRNLHPLYHHWFNHQLTFLLIDTIKQLRNLSQNINRISELTLANSVRIVEEVENGVYHDFIEDKYYCLEVYKEYPGQVDDAATYGDYGIREIPKPEHIMKIDIEKQGC